MLSQLGHLNQCMSVKLQASHLFNSNGCGFAELAIAHISSLLYLLIGIQLLASKGVKVSKIYYNFRKKHFNKNSQVIDCI